MFSSPVNSQLMGDFYLNCVLNRFLKILLAFLLLCISANAQMGANLREISFSKHKMEDVSNPGIADLDKDGIPDSLSYDLNKASLLLTLSLLF